MKGRMRNIRSGLLLMLFLSACTAGELTQAESPTNWGHTTVIYHTNDSSKTPYQTATEATPATINTVIPIKTPTEGPPPDLELLNLKIRYRGDGAGTLFGEIRNNSSITMVFPGEENGRDIPILRFQTEAWDWFGAHGYYWHNEFNIGRGSTYAPNTNCFLYPGETGVISIITPGCQNYPENCVSEHTFIDKPPAAIGMQLVGYQDLKTFIPWSDLYPGYHPQVENLEYSVTDHRIRFEFDLPKSIFKPFYSFMTWVVVYDENGEMLDILQKSFSEELKIDNGGDTYRITGYYGTASDTGSAGSDYFIGELTDEDLERTDHIRVMVERQHVYLCYSNKYDIYREYMANHPE